MKIIAVPNYEALSCCAADIVEAQIRQKPDTCLGTVTGSSPEGMYRELVRRHREDAFDLSRIRTVNTDEYAGLSGTHPSPITTIWRSISSAPAASRRSTRRSRRATQPTR